MNLRSPKAWLPALALLAAGGVGLAQIERLTLDQMVQRADHAVSGTIVKKKAFRIDHPIDGPELYFTTLTVRGTSLLDGQPRQVDVTFPGGFISETEGVWNSEAPTAAETRIGNRVVVFSKWTDNMGGDVAANALIASHGGLYRVAKSRKGDVVLGRGLGYAIASNVKMDQLRGDVAKLVTKHK